MNLSVPKQKIIAFCEAKNKRVVQATGLKLYMKEDIEEIKQGLPFKRYHVFDYFWCTLVDRAKSNDVFQAGLAGETCLWCYAYTCERCTYGKRNGICKYHNEDNRFGRILLRAGSMMSDWDEPSPAFDAKLSNEWYRKTIIEIDRRRDLSLPRDDYGRQIKWG